MNVMSATPTKICKRGRKAKEGNQNKNCRFCGANSEAGEGERHFKTYFRDIAGGEPRFDFSRMLWHNGAVSNQKSKSIGTGLHTM